MQVFRALACKLAFHPCPTATTMARQDVVGRREIGFTPPREYVATVTTRKGSWPRTLIVVDTVAHFVCENGSLFFARKCFQ